MANLSQNPLTWNVPIVTKQGMPTDEFMRKWALQQRINATVPPALTTPAQVSAVLDILGDDKGDLLVRDTALWDILAASTAGHILQTNGAGTLPTWVAPPSGNIQTLLDSISNVRGTVLYRGAGGWAGLAAGAAGTLLTAHGATTDPTWTAPIQAQLDSISNVQGTILYRGAASWSALAVGSAGQVLQTNGAAANPSWGTIASGSGTQFVQYDSGTSSPSTAAFCFKGVSIRPRVNIKLVAVYGLIAPPAGASFAALTGPLSSFTAISPTLTAAPTISPVFTTADLSKRWVRVPFSSPVTLTAGVGYTAMFGRTDLTGTYVLGIAAATTATLLQACDADFGFQNRIANTAPGNGATIDTNTQSIGGIGVALEYTL